ncbi:MAG: hypothetical protein GZ091_11280 [Paludibacter sp.]|nr:hypothetical protein [Paludibacter sp.]
MIYAIIISAVLLAIGIMLLGLRIFFVKDGKFPNFHIGGNKTLRDKGINCATTQDRQAQKTKRMNVDDMITDLKDNY